MKKIILTFAFLCSINSLIGCTCNTFDTYYPIEIFSYVNGRLQIKESRMVFEGTLQKVEYLEGVPSDSSINLTFKVHKNYKNADSNTVNVRTSNPSAGSCGLFPLFEKTYLIFARKFGNNFVTSSCSRSVVSTFLPEYQQFKDFLHILTSSQEGLHSFYKNQEGKLDIKNESLRGVVNALIEKHTEVEDQQKDLREQLF